jgi:hypothetical protein
MTILMSQDTVQYCTVPGLLNYWLSPLVNTTSSNPPSHYSCAVFGNTRLAVQLTPCLRHVAWHVTEYSRTPVSADSVSVVSFIHGLPRPENINTFTAKVDHGRFQYLRFNLPASTLVDLKFTLSFYIQGSLLFAVSGIRGRSWNVSPADTGVVLYINRNYPNCSICRFFPQARPARSPDLTLPDY